MKNQKISVLLTGGTIAKTLCATKLTFDIRDSQTTIKVFNDMLTQSRCNIFYDNLACVVNKDSLDMNDTDRELIYDKCKEMKGKILILHGTDTMVSTARYLSDKKLKYPVVLTGSITPFMIKSQTDALFNLGFAISTLKQINKGIHVCMNGKSWNPFDVIKDTETGFFKES